MKRAVLFLLSVFLWMVAENPLVYAQGAPMPFRIGGTITIDGAQITQAIDDGLVIRVTKQDGTNYADVNGNAPEDKDGLNASNWYMINVPIYQATIQPNGAKPGEAAVIHVLKNNQELQLTTPAKGQITIGDEGKVTQINLVAVTAPSETVSTPSSPSGPASGTTGTSYIYSTGGSSSSKGHSVQYLLDWGDGTNSGWLTEGQTSASKSWPSSGTYSVKAQARCASDTSITSGWSATLAVTISASSQKPNLTPYQPQDWSDAIVVSKETGTSTDSNPLHTTDTLYVDWAVINKSSVDITTRFYVSLLVDGTFLKSWYFDSLNANSYGYLKDYSIGSLGAGTHTVTIVADSDQRISETSETDNEYKRTITVLSVAPNNDLPNLRPYTPKNWSDAVVVSTSPGNQTDSLSYTDEDILYISWAVLNDGPVATLRGFSVDLYVDGWYENTWSSSSPLKPNYYRYVKDYSIWPLSGGDHTIELVVDSDYVIQESDEYDNVYFKEIWVDGITFFEMLPNLTLYQPEGWSDKIVVSSSRKTSTDSNSFTSAETLYVDWAVSNNGQADTPKRASVSLYVDDVLKKTWRLPILKGGGVEPFLAGLSIKEKTNYIVKRYSIGKLSAGDHTLTIVIDPKGALLEDSKADNVYHKSIHVAETP